MMKEDIFYLENWAVLTLKNIKELKDVAIEKNATLFFSINTATHKHSLQKPYTTPVRLLESGAICGVVVFSQIQAMIAANIAKRFVDSVLVDVEEKQGVQVDIDSKLVEHFRIKYSTKSKINSILSAVCSIIKKDRIIEYKPNDLTVDAVWSFLSAKLNHLSGKNIAILGCGNIGSKLALKLAESGVNVIMMRRNSLKGESIVNAINLIKPSASSGLATYSSSAVQASEFCDVVISAANANTPIVTWDVINSMSKDGFVIDIGKGNVSPDVVKNSFKHNIEIFRADITSSLYGFISHRQKIQNIVKYKMGRARINSDISIVSGGVIGKCREIVVDNYKTPALIYGVSDGIGNMKTSLDSIDKKNIEIVEGFINMGIY